MFKIKSNCILDWTIRSTSVFIKLYSGVYFTTNSINNLWSRLRLTESSSRVVWSNRVRLTKESALWESKSKNQTDHQSLVTKLTATCWFSRILVTVHGFWRPIKPSYISSGFPWNPALLAQSKQKIKCLIKKSQCLKRKLKRIRAYPIDECTRLWAIKGDSLAVLLDHILAWNKSEFDWIKKLTVFS